MLGSFVVPAARLAELERQIKHDQRPWTVSALVGPGIEDELELVERFTRSGAGKVTSIEAKVSAPAQIRFTRERVPRHLTIYFEIADLALLSSVRDSGSRAKLRTGGVTPEAFPPAVEVAAFIRARVAEAGAVQVHGRPPSCAALRARVERISAGNPRAVMHGFLNVMLAAAFAQTAVSLEELVEMLEAPSASAFGCEPDGLTWQNYRVTNQQVGLARERGFVSFGSCSFTEPIEELQALEIL